MHKMISSKSYLSTSFYWVFWYNLYYKISALVNYALGLWKKRKKERTDQKECVKNVLSEKSCYRFKFLIEDNKIKCTKYWPGANNVCNVQLIISNDNTFEIM